MKEMITTQTQRIDQLADDRISDLRSDISSVKLDVQNDISEVKKSVDKIYKILIGNGRMGLLQKVERNCVQIKILMYIVGLITSGALGAYFAFDQIDAPAIDGFPKITLSKNVKTNTKNTNSVTNYPTNNTP